MPDPQLVYEVGSRLQGEAGVMGIPGMMAILYSMWSRLCLGGKFTRGAEGDEAIWVILEAYYGRAVPGSVALFLAYFLVAYPDDVPKLVAAAGLMRFEGPLPFAMSQQDVEKHGYRSGNVTIIGQEPYAVHLYAKEPKKRGG